MATKIPVFRLTEGDTVSKLRVTCTDAETGDIIDITDYSEVKLHYTIDGVSKVPINMTKVLPYANGIVTYQFGSGELVAGWWECEISLTVGSLSNISTKFNLAVEPRV